MEQSMIMPHLPSDAKARKAIPIYSGCIRYFPDALAAVAQLSQEGNEQHNPGTPLHWDRSKSGDELDAMMRHIIEGDWRAVAWRALAHLQKYIEAEQEEAELMAMSDASCMDIEEALQAEERAAGLHAIDESLPTREEVQDDDK